MSEKVEIQYEKTEVKSIWGGHRVSCFYTLTHRKNSQTNQYDIVCDVGGLDEGKLYLCPKTATFVGDIELYSNEETLVESAVLDLFEDYISK